VRRIDPKKSVASVRSVVYPIRKVPSREIKRYNDVLASFQTVHQLQPDHYKAHYYAGLVHEGQNEMEKAKKQYRAAIQTIDRMKIRYAWPFADLGKLLVNEGDHER
jgi:tetratricopeptide (TPR) repeat protein